LSYLELPSEFCSDLDSYKVHPALLDIATSAGAFLIAQDAQSYLPFSYKRLIVKKPLTQKLYSHFRRRSSSGANEEMMTFDIVIMDHEGHELVEIEEFAVKRVGEAAAQELRARGERSVESLGQTPSVPAVGNGYVKDGILPKEGVEVFRRSLSASYLPQLIVSATDINARIRQVAEQSQPGKVKTAEKGRETKSLHKRPKLRTAFVAPRNELETAIAAIWQSILGIQDIGVHDNFLELGGHSLSGIRMISRIREDIQVAIPIDAVFKSPTIAELAQTVVDTVSQEVDEETLAQAISEVRQQEIVLQ
jgi:polyketide synthase PksJ